MAVETYAIVAYLHGPLAEFVDGLRKELDPTHAGKAAHLTLLPPRPLSISEEEALEQARAYCADWEPFPIEIGGVATFLPPGVVYVELAEGSEQMGRLHSELNRGCLAGEEAWSYVPHITIAQDLDGPQTRELAAHVSERLAAYRGPRRLLVDKLTFVRQSPAGDWIDLADVQLGQAPVLV